MFQPATVVVKDGLVQLPDICVGPRSTRAGPAAAVDELPVDPPAAVVVVDPPAAVVVVDPPAAVVVDPPLLSGAVVLLTVPLDVGSLYAGAPDDDAVAEPPVVPLIANPASSAAPANSRSCHVDQLRLPFMWSSPGAGTVSAGLSTPP
jgi:hypothetical protein